MQSSLDEDGKENVANVIGQIFPSINRLADGASYSLTAVFTFESQRESSLEDNEEAKMKSDDKDGNKMSCLCHACGSYFHLFHMLSCLY